MVSTRSSTAAATATKSKAGKKTPKKKVTKEEVEEEVESTSVTPKKSKRQNVGAKKGDASDVQQVKEKQTSPSPKKEIKSSPSQNTNNSVKETVMINKGKELEYEFGGPIGALAVMFLLPVVIYGLFFLCNKDYCLTFENILLFDWNSFQQKLPDMNGLLNERASYMFVGWIAFHILLERILPGEVAYGTQLRNGGTLSYCMSGHLQFWVTVLVIFFGNIEYFYDSAARTLSLTSIKGFPVETIYDEYLTLITASVVFSVLLSLFVYIKSFVPDALLAEGGDSGNVIYDFFIGRELNPRIGSFDIKEFCELRPGLIGWMVINLGMAAKQMQATGSLSLSMILINVFQGFYVWDALHSEKSILSTMDITTDGFGYMLAFGDLAWVPFIYSLQARYLVDYDPHMNISTIAAILMLQGFGYYVFRAANSEKDTFRRNPQDPRVNHLTYMETKRGTRLITSGWWGMARKINYTGDWIMTFSWCLLCGWQSPIPYFQAVYFLILLIHRAIRDDKMCHEKYGDDWIEYKRRVPYVFIPYIV